MFFSIGTFYDTIYETTLYSTEKPLSPYSCVTSVNLEDIVVAFQGRSCSSHLILSPGNLALSLSEANSAPEEIQSWEARRCGSQCPP